MILGADWDNTIKINHDVRKEDIVSILFDGPHDYDALVEQIEKNDNFVLGLEQ